MKKNAARIWSILLLIASLLGLIGGGTTLKGVTDAKAYWEEKGSGSSGSLDQLEEGLKTLQESEEAYYTGRDTLAQGKLDYEAGVKALEDGRAQYEAGQKTLEEGRAEYEAGQKTLEEKQAEYDAGAEALAAAEAQLAAGKAVLDENKDAYEQGKATLAAMKEAYEAGKVTLEENADAYEQGLVTLEENKAAYEEGKATLAAMEEAYEAGKVTLEQNRDAYEQGKAMLEENKDAYEQGKAALAAAEEQLAGAKALTEGLSQVLAGYQGVTDEKTKELVQPGYAQGFQSVLEFSETDAGKALQIFKDGNLNTELLEGQIARLKTAKADEAQITPLETLLENVGTLREARKSLTEGINRILAGIQSNEALASQLPESAAKAVEALNNPEGSDTEFNAVMEQLIPVAQGLKAQVDAGITQGEQQYEAGLAQVQQYEEGLAQVQQYEEGLAQVQAYEEGLAQVQAYEAGLAQVQAYEEGLALVQQYEDGLASVEEYETGLASYEAGLEQYEAGKAQLDEGAQQLAAGKAQLEAAAQQLADGEQQLEDAAQQLKDGEQQLQDAEQQLQDGEAKLGEFEAGRDQIIAGLEQVLGTQGDGGLAGVAERLGKDFSYMKNDTDLDIEKGLEAVAAARALSADTTAAVTKELTNKAAASVITIIASVVAAVAGLMGLASKPKLETVLACAGALAAVIGLIVWLSAGGSNFSKAAGVNTGAMLPFSQILLGLFGVLDFTQNRKPTEVSTKNTKNTKNGKKAKK